MKLLLILLALMCAIGCASSATTFAQARYPDCLVEEIESDGYSTRLLISCPGEAPFEKTIHENK